MCQVRRPGRVAATNRALVEVAFKNIATAKCLVAKTALIGSLARV